MDIIRQALGLSPPTPTNLTDYISVALRSSTGHNAKASIRDGIATFYTNTTDKIYSLEIGIAPRQEGSGDPSPENIRPLSGWTGATIYHSGADTSAPDIIAVSWEDEAGTVYGGTLDVTTGLLTVDRIRKMFNGSESGWELNGNYGVAYNLNALQVGSINLTEPPIADYLTTLPQGQGGLLTAWQCRYNPRGTHFLVKGDGAVDTSVAAWKAYLVEHPLTVVFCVESAEIYQLPSTEITALLGVNNVWADTGPIIELLY